MASSHTSQCLVKQCRYQCTITAWCTHRRTTHGWQPSISMSFSLWRTATPATRDRTRCLSLSFETLGSIQVCSAPVFPDVTFETCASKTSIEVQPQFRITFAQRSRDTAHLPSSKAFISDWLLPGPVPHLLRCSSHGWQHTPCMHTQGMYSETSTRWC
jgi:hypothetical protein